MIYKIKVIRLSRTTLNEYYVLYNYDLKKEELEMKNILIGCLSFLLVIGVCMFMGCDETSEGYKNHVPAEGMGSLVAYNRSAAEISGYVDGYHMGNVMSWEYVVKDYDPGTYTVVILQVDGNKNYTADLEVLEGVLTVLKVSYGDGSSKYFSVETEYVDKKTN